MSNIERIRWIGCALKCHSLDKVAAVESDSSGHVDCAPRVKISQLEQVSIFV